MFARIQSIIPRVPRGSRGVFVIAESTPNPEAIMFYPQGKQVLGHNAKTKSYADRHGCRESPLAAALFKIQGINQVLLGQRHITITKGNGASWDHVKPNVELVVSQFFATQIPIIDESKVEYYEDPKARQKKAEEAGIEPRDKETMEAQINDLIIERVQPFVQQDGGDIEFIKYENNAVYLKLQGACAGCPKSSVTLQFQIKNLLQHFFPEIKEVIGVDDFATDISEIDMPRPRD